MGMSISLALSIGSGGGGGGGGLLATKRILFIGDSTMAGRGAGTGAANMDGARVLSMPTRTAVKLAADGFSALSQDNIGDALNGTANLATYDPRILVTGAALATASEGPTIGGVIARFTSTTTLDFTPTADVDRCEVYSYNLAGYGTMRLSADGVALTPDMVLTAAPSTFVKYTFSFTKGRPVLRLSAVSGTVRRAGMVCWDSTTPSFVTMNAGTRTWTTADFQVATNAVSPFNAPGTYVGAGDLIIANLGINDNATNISQAAYEANLGALVDQWKATGAGVILQIPTPIGGDGTGITQAQMTTSINTISTAKSLPTPIDSPAATGTWAAMVTAGETVDTFHLTAAPYDRVAVQQIAPAIRSYYGV